MLSKYLYSRDRIEKNPLLGFITIIAYKTPIINKNEPLTY